MYIYNIGCLVNVRGESNLLRGKELQELLCIDNAWLQVKDEKIVDYGEMDWLDLDSITDKDIDAKKAYILPCWCDSHTHIVYAASRENEFVEKIKGSSYEEIAAKGGGILNSALRLQQMSENDLLELSAERLHNNILNGTGAIEIKSGYGLTLDAELKMLRVIQRLKQKYNVGIKATFLGAHALPHQYKQNREAYIQLVIKEILPAIAKEKLADFIDVFCEKGFFTVDEMMRILEAALQYNLQPKLHVNQFNSIGAVQAGIKYNAVSLDHLETVTDDDAYDISNSSTIATLLPTAAYFLRMQYAPARKMIDAGCAVAIASDHNPGSSPSGNMNTVVSMSCIQMKMLPEEAINAATINGAYAMQFQHDYGSITTGKFASFIFMKSLPSLAYIPYTFGGGLIDKVMLKGSFI